ncbi:MAG: aldehyde dehydrogenase family protein, partial [Acidobacteria bacterium]|nr:aldehyde dehydrogenase family protein [Acidobacteriota bacterium]
MALMKDSSVAAGHHVDISADLRARLERQRAALARDGAPDYRRRGKALDALLDGILARKEEFVRAASEDFGGRAREETLLLELAPLVGMIRHARSHLKRWMKPRTVRTGWQFWPARSRVIYQPRGVVGIISPWNYPVYLSLAPLVDAIAAGNHALVKPSELTPQSSELLRSFVASNFSDEYVAVVTGGP